MPLMQATLQMSTCSEFFRSTRLVFEGRRRRYDVRTDGIATDAYVNMHTYRLKEPYGVVGLIFPSERADLNTSTSSHRRWPQAAAQSSNPLRRLPFRYDRTQALRDGSIRVEGVELNYLNMQPAEIFWRQLQFQEFDASEMSLSNYASLVSTGKSPFIAIPVFRRGCSVTATSSSIPRRGSRPAPTSKASAAACRNIR